MMINLLSTIVLFLKKHNEIVESPDIKNCLNTNFFEVLIPY